ncbi:hypothetical protein HD806DRAFT_545573 [Xylariaceae sp. AK1471]|nr:hypothetical protein HD806DRAFT_545573 [Xylariaceae sp. AK1471]
MHLAAPKSFIAMTILSLKCLEVNITHTKTSLATFPAQNMDADPQDRGTLFRRWSDSDIIMKPQSARYTQPYPSSMQEPDDWAQAQKNVFTMVKDAKEAEESGNEAEMPKQQPKSPRAKSPLKQRPFSSRLSTDMFRNLILDEDDKSKRGSLSVGDNMSISTCGSVDERRLSDKMKKAWRGVTGHKQVDPLHQWMVQHSGGTLRDHRPSREPSGEH